MNLDEWSSLSTNLQREWIIKLYKEDLSSSAYADLSEKAVRNLKDALSGNLNVTNVRGGGGEIIAIPHPGVMIREVILHVCTLLPEHHRDESLPEKFSGFRVVQLNLGDRRDSFFRTLIFITNKLKGWTETETLKWANERPNESLNDSLSGGFFYDLVQDRGPVLMALSAIAEQVKNEFQNFTWGNFYDLRNAMLTVISEATRKAGSLDFYHPDRVPNFDWESAKIKINTLIEQAVRHR